MDDTKDFGTPKKSSEKLINLNIDGIDVSVPEGTSIMRAASEAGVSVPSLCATDSLDPFGSCRLCLVEIEGKRGYPASCTTPVEQDLKNDPLNNPNLNPISATVFGLIYFPR